jgi:NADPH-dependent 2,4-dienoyl-CoA reductase/sulfur reductase-like enzyme
MAESKHTVNGISATLNTNTKDVEIAPPSGISVLVVGAGVGGLVAALECARKGHSVRIFEREKAMSSAGLRLRFSITSHMILKGS